MQQEARNDDAMRAISKAVWINEGGSWGIRAGRVSAALQGFPAPMYQDVSGVHKSHMTRAVFRRGADAVTKYGNMDRVPKPNEMCSAAQPQFLLSILEGLVALPCVRCDRVFPVTLDMIDSAAYLVPPGQLHHCHHLTVALLLSIELGACCISRLCTCTGMPAWGSMQVSVMVVQAHRQPKLTRAV